MRYSSCILIICVLFAAENLSAQENSGYDEKRSELTERQQSTRSQIENLEDQIATYTERLGFATDRYDQMFRQYEEQDRVITLQREQIRQMNLEQEQIREEILLIQTNLNELEQELKYLVEQYKDILSYLYKHGRNSEIALLFTSTTFNQLVVRSFYLAKFDEYRQQQVDEIAVKQAELENTKSDLEETEEKNRESLASIENEMESLEQKLELQERNIELLRRDRNNLQEQLNSFQQQRDELDSVLEELIAEEEEILRNEEERQRRLAAAGEIEDDDERRAAEARYSRPAGSTASVNSEELAAYETDFENQRGDLPWPVENGTITEKFGVRTHPVFRTQTNNPGIDIAAAPGSSVKVVADGYVFGIQPFSGFGEVILVNHGTYKTAYGNLSEILVRKNQVLQQGDVIGRSGDENSIRGEVLFFLVRDGSQFVDPENWIQRPVQ